MWSFYLDLSSGANDRLTGEEKKTGEKDKRKKKKKNKKNLVVLPGGEDTEEEGKEGGVLVPESSRKEKDRAAFVASLERHAGTGGGISTKFIAAIKAANSRGWVRCWREREGGREEW